MSKPLAIFKHPWLRHLRLPFNLLLSPIFLWGVLLAGGSLFDIRFCFAYLALHVFLYGGTTAFNSYYDRDEGPVGGMLEPPPVDNGLLWFSLLFQALALPLVLLTGWHFTLAWLLLFLIATAYSHPLIRLKAHPLAALLAVGLGQGAVGFAGGWLLARPSFTSLLSAEAIWGMITTALIVLGLYIVTQSYQRQEDEQRGDRTLPVLLGSARALKVALVLLALGGLIMLLGLGGQFGWVWSLLLGVFFLCIAVTVLSWADAFDEDAVKANFKRAMRTTTISSTGLSLFLLYHLAGF
jgi:4-hydroxybenzoate polyprenyltransferase